MQVHIGSIRRCGQSFLREHLKKYSLSPLDSVVMHSLKKHGRCNQEQLCSIVDIDKGRMARIMEQLEERGFIGRVVNISDKREKLIELTQEGHNMLHNIDSIFDEWNDVCFTDFTEEEKNQYQKFLARIAKNAMTWKEN